MFQLALTTLNDDNIQFFYIYKSTATFVANWSHHHYDCSICSMKLFWEKEKKYR